MRKIIAISSILTTAAAVATVAAVKKVTELNHTLIDIINDLINDNDEIIETDDEWSEPFINLYVLGEGCEALKLSRPRAGDWFRLEVNPTIGSIKFVDPSTGVIWYYNGDIKKIDMSEEGCTFTTGKKNIKFSIKKVKAVGLEEAHRIYDETHKREED